VRPQQNGCGMRTSPSIAPDIERDGIWSSTTSGLWAVPGVKQMPEMRFLGLLSKIYWKDRIESSSSHCLQRGGRLGSRCFRRSSAEAATTLR
jgi:hypothetical protein